MRLVNVAHLSAEATSCTASQDQGTLMLMTHTAIHVRLIASDSQHPTGGILLYDCHALPDAGLAVRVGIPHTRRVNSPDLQQGHVVPCVNESGIDEPDNRLTVLSSWCES